MKHAILAFVLAWLAACAGAAPGPSAPAEPALQLSGRTLRACTPLAGTALPLCRGGALPAAIGRVVTAAPASFEALDASLYLIVDAERHGWLCLLDGDQVRCTPVAAPAPQNMEIRFWHLPDGYHAVTYTHIPGTPIVLDPGAQATNAFQRALEAAAVQLQSSLAAGAGRNARPATGARIDGCDAPDESGGCVMDGDPGLDPGYDQGGGGGDPFGDWDNGPGPGTDPPSDPWGGWDNGPGPGTDTPADLPAADPDPWTDPYCDNGPCPGSAIEDVPPMIPTLPHDPATDTADLTPCDAVIPGIISICIHERRPPPAELAPLPAGPAPWFPQSWCDFAGVFCSNGQVQKSAESGKTLAELADDCAFHLRVKLDLCKVDDIIHPNTQRYADCLQAARDEYEVCVTRARDLTDNGAHPAP